MTPTPNIWFYEAGFNTPRMCLVKFYSLWDLHKQEAILVIRTARPLYIGCFFYTDQIMLCSKMQLEARSMYTSSGPQHALVFV